MKGSVFLLVMALLPALALADCTGETARFHQVDVRLVHTIAQAESRIHADVVGANSDGGIDIGLMRINSSWLPSLVRYGITRAHLFDVCVNAYVGSWILSRNTQQFGPMWDAVEAYDAKSPAKRLVYARKVYQALATVSSTPSRATVNLVASVRSVGASRVAARRLQMNTSSGTTTVSWKLLNE